MSERRSRTRGLGWVMVASLALGGCFSPSFEPCALECGAARSCPPELMCLSDGMCHADEDEALCTTSQVDAAPPDAAMSVADAGPLVPDAAEGEPDAAPDLDAAVPRCGNGSIDGDEDCDDDNRNGSDGCSAMCTVEDGFVCVGAPSTCRPQARAGDLVITEIMKNPDRVSDANGEWFEVHSIAGEAIDLQGVTFESNIAESFEVDRSLPVEPDRAVVFGANDDPDQNGGAAVDFDYDQPAFQLGNSSDRIRIFDEDGAPIDDVTYTDIDFPDPDGASLSLDPSSYEADDNDLGASWCEGSEQFGGNFSDLGSPGEKNPICPPPPSREGSPGR